MIGYIEGKLLKKEKDRALILSGQVGYEVMLPGVVMEGVKEKEIGGEVSFYIYWHQTQGQPKPSLIGFNLEAEKEFFQRFISVADIGPMKAVKAMGAPIQEIAKAIETKDAGALGRLKGVGPRTAQKIIASLSGKMGRFLPEDGPEPGAGTPPALGDAGRRAPDIGGVGRQVVDVLVSRLGHHPAEAEKMVARALRRGRTFSDPGELFDEIYRAGEAGHEDGGA
ncbi:Holliday junction ATP-dependent DNA helicase RuvA [Candidatus Desulfarcum epimagneticum]|uniref:Holliday junction branch migration complex subunit RuvA n=1 Tax=uncultured Desulfobacteraceae bacterium TaxID=218296 RepID=A0A484HKQ0_9BACT|nr:Holliday junction ATP-dependent DNA helicase RuvA [uncultured Desulfobacteraceae bacterium]